MGSSSRDTPPPWIPGPIKKRRIPSPGVLERRASDGGRARAEVVRGRTIVLPSGKEIPEALAQSREAARKPVLYKMEREGLTEEEVAIVLAYESGQLTPEQIRLMFPIVQKRNAIHAVRRRARNILRWRKFAKVIAEDPEALYGPLPPAISMAVPLTLQEVLDARSPATAGVRGSESSEDYTDSGDSGSEAGEEGNGDTPPCPRSWPRRPRGRPR